MLVDINCASGWESAGVWEAFTIKLRFHFGADNARRAPESAPLIVLWTRGKLLAIPFARVRIVS